MAKAKEPNRRTKGTGSVRAKGNRWYYSFKDVDGKRVERPGGKTKDDALDALAIAVGRVAEGIAQREAGYPFGDFAETWLKQIKGVVSKSTYLTSYKGIVENHLIPAFENDLLHQMDISLINEYRRAKLEGDEDLPVRGSARQLLAPKTVHNHMVVLQTILEAARDQGLLIGENPAAKAAKPSSTTVEVEPLNPAQIKALMEHMPARYKMLTRTLIQQGLRVGEALALRITDYDAKKRTIHVRRSVKRLEGGKLTAGAPKTKRAIRPLPVSEQFDKALQAHLSEMQAQKVPNPLGLIFPSDGESFLSPDNYRNRGFKKAAKAAGISKHATVHTLRHTYASLAIDSTPPMNIEKLSRRLGHANTATTLNVYGHLMEPLSDEGDVIDLD